MKSRPPLTLRTSWWVPVKISSYDISEYLPDDCSTTSDIEISISFNVSPPNPEVGIFNEQIEYDGMWAVPNNLDYSVRLKEAIDSYLVSIDVVETFKDKLNEQMDSFYESMKYPNL